MAQKIAQKCNTSQLNRRISIQNQSSTQDGAGQPIQSWTTVYTCWADIDILHGQLIYNTGDFVSKATQIITIRFTSSQVFSSGQRIVYTETTTGVVHTYEIQSILNPAQGNVWLQFLAYEINPAE
jgi:SPP1 family predicted phage head-tail adaptor